MYLQSIVCTLLYESIFPFGYFNDIKLQYEFLVAKATSKIVYREWVTHWFSNLINYHICDKKNEQKM